MNLVAETFGFVLCAFIGLLAATIVIWIWQGKIDLSALLSEPTGQASMSRFQLLIFTFVIAVSLFAMVEARVNPNGFPEIPGGVLTLLGISASTYAVSKGITYSQPQTIVPQIVANDSDSSAADAAVAAAQAAATQAAVHAATAQQAVQQTADNAAKAKQAADQATGNQ
jgi:hypothetical protein